MPSEIQSRFPRSDYEPAEELDIPPTGHRVRRQSSGLDRGTRRLAVVAGGIGGALVLIVGAWSLAGHRNHIVPILEAPNGPVRVKPANPGGMQVTGADDTLLSGSSGKENEALAPPPEAPEPKALQAQRHPDQTRQLPPSPVPKAPSLPSLAAAPSVALPAAVAATKPVPTPPARTATAAHQTVAATAPVTKAPSSASAASPTHSAMGQPAASSSKLAAGSHGPAVAAVAGHSAGHAKEVQLAALQSEEAAKTEWGRLAKRMPDLFNGRHPAVIRAEHDGHVYWRLRTGGFGDATQATQFCEHVRAKGSGCSVASF